MATKMAEKPSTTAPETRTDQAMAIPEDPEQSIYRFIIVAAKRARQLQSGVRPKVQPGTRKATRVAVEETKRGLIPFIDPERAQVEEPVEEDEASNQ